MSNVDKIAGICYNEIDIKSFQGDIYYGCRIENI